MARPRVDPVKRFWDFVEKTETCWWWNGSLKQNGYGVFSIGPDQWKAHRYSYEMHKGPIPDGMCVCHECDNKACVNPAHLWLGTVNDNVQDKIRKRRIRVPIGEENGSFKLTDAQVLEIRASTESTAVLAKTHAVSQTQICRIKKGTSRALLTHEKWKPGPSSCT